jgi:zinc protease
LFNLERYDLGLDYYRRYPDLVRGITRDEILETARRYLSAERMGVAVAGP